MKAVVVMACATLVLGASACAGGAGAENEATITIRYSAFVPEEITAHAGEPITFTLRNQDPIEHEWIVGSEDMHARHRTGTEPVHDQIPTEITIPALSTRTTTITFEEPGEYRYICHLPGHETYGMVGALNIEGS